MGGSTETWPTLTGISDHAPVHCTIDKVMRRPQNKATFYTPLLNLQEGYKQLQEAWTTGIEATAAGTWSSKVIAVIQSTTRCSDNMKKRAATAKKELYREQFKSLMAAEIALQQDWSDGQARQDLSRAQQALHQTRMEQQDKWKTKLDIKWNKVGDSCSNKKFRISLEAQEEDPH